MVVVKEADVKFPADPKPKPEVIPTPRKDALDAALNGYGAVVRNIRMSQTFMRDLSTEYWRACKYLPTWVTNGGDRHGAIVSIVLPDSHEPGFEIDYRTPLEIMGFSQTLTHGLPCRLEVRP